MEQPFLLLEQLRPLVGERRATASAFRRRWACHTMAPNIADSSGTSKSSSQVCVPANASAMIETPVAAITTARTIEVVLCDQTRKP